jgi:hypothetical protein
MDRPSDADPADPVWLRYRDNPDHLRRMLKAALPPIAPGGTEYGWQRDNAAIEQVASLCPADAAEAALALQHVVLQAHAMEFLRRANQPGTVPAQTLRCTAQAANMMRQAEGALRLLLRMQDERRKRQADKAWRDRANRTQHWVSKIMTGAAQESWWARFADALTAGDALASGGDGVPADAGESASTTQADVATTEEQAVSVVATARRPAATERGDANAEAAQHAGGAAPASRKPATRRATIH